MSTIVTRAGKGTALTWEEADANFTNLNTDKLEAGFSSSLVEFTPAGTEAIPTNVQTKLRGITSVTDYMTSAQIDDVRSGTGSIDVTDAIQEAINAMEALGGGIVQAHDLAYKIAGIVYLKDNVHLEFGTQTVIDCSTSAAAFTFYALGTVGEEVPLSVTVTSGESVIQTTTPHGLQVGDWALLKSQRACLHDDAGYAWRLGETTGGTTSPFFAEPVQIFSVDSATQVTVTSGLIFPDYRPDKTLETYFLARDSSTLCKINFVENVRLTGGRFIKSTNGKTLVRMSFCLRPYIEIADAQLGLTVGACVDLRGCLEGNVKARAERPADFEVVVDHSLYNSFKDVGSWYCTWDVVDYNGSQGWDQSFSSGEHPSICPTLKMKSINSREDGATTHGACYGADIDIQAFSPRFVGFRNRARFSRIKARVIGDKSGGTSGVLLSSWGGLDTVVYDSFMQATPIGIEIDPEGITDISPPEANLTITDCTFIGIFAGQIIYLRDRATPNTTLSNVNIKNITARDCKRGIYIGEFWHGVNVSDINITRMDTDTARYGVEWRPDAAKGVASRIFGNDIGVGNTLVRIGSFVDASVSAAFDVMCWLDGNSIKVNGSGSKLLRGNNMGYISDSGTWQPSFTGTVNSVPSVTVQTWNYSISGDIVTISGILSTVAAAAGQCRTNISVVPNTTSNFSSTSQASGTGVTSNTSSNRFGSLFADITNEQLTFEWYSTTLNENKTFYVIGQYRLTRQSP